MIGIVGISSYVPSARLDLLAAAPETDHALIRGKTGFFRVARRAADEECSDLAAKAVEAAFDAHPGLRDKLQLLILVTQNPDGTGLPHASAILHGKLGLGQSVAAFDVSLGCSGWVYGVSLAKAFMELNGFEHGLLVTADPYSKILDPADRNTSLLFGDAATATVLGPAPRWEIGRSIFGTEGQKAADLAVQDNGLLAMNGRAVFTFTASKIPGCVTDTLAANGFTVDSIGRILLHQASRYIVETIGDRLGVPDKVPFIAEEVGNTVSSSIPLALAQGHGDGFASILVCGFGVGLSWAATVLTSCERISS